MRVRPLVVVALAIALFVAAASVPTASARYGGAGSLPLPTSMAALGDSITTGYNACGRFEDCPERSWSTGDDPAVRSHYQRLLAISPGIEGHATNLARAGAKVDDLTRQATEAVADNPNYVTILIGANDACTSSEATMTPVTDFRAHLDEGMDVLRAGLPKTRVLIVSIPDLLRLWEVEHRDRTAQLVWFVGSICQSMLENARAVDPDNTARRERVRQRVVDYNEQLREACAAYGPLCRFDDGAVFAHPFEAGDVSSWDAFHPDESGQAVLADVSNTAGYRW